MNWWRSSGECVRFRSRRVAAFAGFPKVINTRPCAVVILFCASQSGSGVPTQRKARCVGHAWHEEANMAIEESQRKAAKLAGTAFLLTMVLVVADNFGINERLLVAGNA